MFDMQLGENRDYKKLNTLGLDIKDANVSKFESCTGIHEKIIYADVDNQIYGETALGKKVPQDMILNHGVIYVMQSDASYVIRY